MRSYEEKSIKDLDKKVSGDITVKADWSVEIGDENDSNGQTYGMVLSELQTLIGGGGGSTTKIQDTDGDTYVDTESSADVDIVELGSPNTGTSYIAKFISDTGGTPTEVLQVDGDGNLFNQGNAVIYEPTSGSVLIKTASTHSTMTGTLNIGIGPQSLNATTTGFGNCAYGYYSARILTQGIRNTLYGANSGDSILTGDYNVLVGYNSDVGGATNNNTQIGSNTGSNTGGSNCLFAGYGAGTYQSGVSNKIIFDTIQRADLATENSDSPIVITTNATKSSQTGSHNYAMTISNGLTGNIFTVSNTTNDVFKVDNNGLSTIYGNTSSATNTGLQIEQDGTGDARLNFLLTGGQTYSMGINNSESGDPLVISGNADLETSEMMRMKADGDTTVAGYLEAKGFRQASYEAEDETYAITDKDFLIIMKPVLSATTATLPAISSSNDGQIYYFACRADVETVTVQTTGGDILGNTGSSTSTTMTAGQYLGYQASNDLSRWLQISG
jgi:hypothetical protein